MKTVHIPDKVVLYLEDQERVGTFHDLKRDRRAYINADTVEVVLHLTRGGSLNSFFKSVSSLSARKRLISNSDSVIRQLINEGFLLETGSKRRGIIKEVKSSPPLRVVFIETTKKCNLRCRHCYVQGSGSDSEFADVRQINFTDICNLITQIDDLGVMEVQLTGGELFVLPYALDVIRDIQRRLIPCSVFTNGTLMTEDIFDYLAENNHGLIFYISLDGFRKTHDTFRQSPGSFDKAVEAINILLRMDCDVRINTSIGRHNIGEIGRFVQFVRDEFGTLHRLVSVEPIGRANMEMTISAEEFARVLKDSRNTLEFLDSHDSLSDWYYPACGIGSSMLFVDACGSVSFCPTLTQRENVEFLAGDIFHSSLKEIWENSLSFKRFREMQCVDVGECEFKQLCKGGCRSRAYLLTGNVNSPDLAMCSLYGKQKPSL